MSVQRYPSVFNIKYTIQSRVNYTNLYISANIIVELDVNGRQRQFSSCQATQKGTLLVGGL